MIFERLNTVDSGWVLQARDWGPSSLARLGTKPLWLLVSMKTKSARAAPSPDKPSLLALHKQHFNVSLRLTLPLSSHATGHFSLNSYHLIIILEQCNFLSLPWKYLRTSTTILFKSLSQDAYELERGGRCARKFPLYHQISNYSYYHRLLTSILAPGRHHSCW